MTDLSVLIPSRNEEFLNQTIADILAHAETDVEVIVTLDGQWPVVPVPDNERVALIYHPESVGQRAATNDAARMARGRYVMKCDAHCAFDQGFDRIMLEDMAGHDDWTMVPVMRNLHVFDWVCPNGHRRYQGPSGPCRTCGEPTTKDIVWIAKQSPQSRSYCFDSEPHFQYFREFSKRPEGKGDVTETMSLQGSCFLLTRDKYWDLDICGEEFGSWGSQGIEVACKTWLSGGRCVVNQRTWYAHCFRTQGGDFGFPYHLGGRQVEHAKRTARNVFFENKWSRQIHPISWLVEKFWPVPGWTDADLARLRGEAAALPVTEAVPSSPEPQASLPDGPSKAILYYTDNRLPQNIMEACQCQLERAGLPIVSVSLEPMRFGHNIVVEGERGPLTMFRQILAGLEAITADVVFFAEHDVLYDLGHFDFTPPERDRFYYNNNIWKVDAETGRSLFHYSNHTSQLCAWRELLVEHYRKRIAMVEANGFTRRMGYEPGTHNRAERVDDYGHETWMGERPNLDIRHRGNLTETRWRREQFRNQKYTRGWTEADEVPPWYGPGGFGGMLHELAQ